MQESQLSQDAILLGACHVASPATSKLYQRRSNLMPQFHKGLSSLRTTHPPTSISNLEMLLAHRSPQSGIVSLSQNSIDIMLHPSTSSNKTCVLCWFFGSSSKSFAISKCFHDNWQRLINLPQRNSCFELFLSFMYFLEFLHVFWGFSVV